MIYFLAKGIHWVFWVYTLFLMVRVIGSWFPRVAYHPAMRFVRFYTDPYLGLFRRIVPPIGGALDLSPLIGFFALRILESMILGLLGGLI